MWSLADPAIFSITLAVFAAILLLLIYYVLTLADLESDYLNVNDCCSKMNIWVIPKCAAHAVVMILTLLGGHWILFLIHLPMVSWLTFEILRLPRYSLGVYDPVEIHGRGMLKVYLRNCMIYLGFYFVMFFITLYYMISSLLEGDPLQRHLDDEIITKM